MGEPIFDHQRLDVYRVASMLTRLIQRVQRVSEESIEYEYEYRGAEYEYEAQ